MPRTYGVSPAGAGAPVSGSAGAFATTRMRSRATPQRATTSSAVACETQMTRWAERAAARASRWYFHRVRGAKSPG